MKTRSYRNRGFTLVELLVVIAIIGVLVSLLLPAVQSAREAARRMSCSNNLHQFGVALQNYHDSLTSFPSGWLPRRDPSSATLAAVNSEAWGWSALLLPYLEQQGLYDTLRVSKGYMEDSLTPDPNIPNDLTNAKNAAEATKTILKAFLCPSDTGFIGRGQVEDRRSFNGGKGFAKVSLTTAAQCRVGLSNYVGVAGHRRIVPSATLAYDTPNTGIFYADSYIRMSDIIDGTSNTIAVGERQTLDCAAGTWVGVRNPNGYGAQGAPAVVGHSHPKLNQDITVFAYNGAQGCGEGFASFHPNGAMFLFCDGSAKFVPNSINYFYQGNGVNAHKNPTMGTYQRLMSRNDKLTVSF
jgi:prepilin-type N-terminal cleavage/methylation domain-containing protein/prepilin-type processing-associated H-X9-DG protein